MVETKRPKPVGNYGGKTKNQFFEDTRKGKNPNQTPPVPDIEFQKEKLRKEQEKAEAVKIASEKLNPTPPLRTPEEIFKPQIQPTPIGGGGGGGRGDETKPATIIPPSTTNTKQAQVISPQIQSQDIRSQPQAQDQGTGIIKDIGLSAAAGLGTLATAALGGGTFSIAASIPVAVGTFSYLRHSKVGDAKKRATTGLSNLGTVISSADNRPPGWNEGDALVRWNYEWGQIFRAAGELKKLNEQDIGGKFADAGDEEILVNSIIRNYADIQLKFVNALNQPQPGRTFSLGLSIEDKVTN